MLVKSAYKFRIYPTEEQKGLLAHNFGQARFVYNHFLTVRKEHYLKHGESLGYAATNKMLTRLKRTEGFRWLKMSNAQALQCSLRNLETAYKKFFEMVNKGTLPKPGKKARKDGMPKGYPSYHSRKDKQSITIPQNFKVQGSRFYLPKVGWIRTIFHRPIEGKTKGFVVSKSKSGKYYLSVKVEKEVPDPEFIGPKVGIDLGLTHFAICSTGEKVDNPRFYRKAERRIKQAHRAFSRKKKNSKNREKARQRLAREYEKVNARRQDFTHKLSTRLTRENSLIKIENLNVCGMIRNHKLAKSIQDAGWSEFCRQLEYKGEWNGCVVERIDRWFPSTKTCSECDFVNNDLKLHHRFWTCPNCGTEHDRDINSSVTILNYNGTVGATETAIPNGVEKPAPELTGGTLFGAYGTLVGEPAQEIPVIAARRRKPIQL